MAVSAKQVFALSVGVAVALGVWLARKPSPAVSAERPRALLVYCAAGLKPPVERVAREFTRRYGVEVQLQFGGSGTLLSNLRVAQRGDLFVAADAGYIATARSNALLAEVIPLARLKPVLVVRRGNPKQIRAVADLARSEVSAALANPEAAAIGQAVREALSRAGVWPEIARHAKVFKPTVNDVANDVKLGTVDAGIVWDATARQYPELESLEEPLLASVRSEVAIGVLSCCAQPTWALRFARYLGGADAGLQELARDGYDVVEGDRWIEQPEVVLYSGGVNRLAIEPVIQRFEAREGARVTRVYNGCGILVAQMKAGQHPDAYLACDVTFHTPVQELFGAPVEVSETDIVLLVKRGNPDRLETLKDLARPGVRVGVANAQQSTLGDLTAKLLRAAGVHDPVMANVRVQTPTADLLVNQMRAGSLDAAVVYEVNTSQVRDQLTVVPLLLPGARAVQPYAVGKDSGHRLLMERLLAALRTAESRRQYEATGFRCRP